MSFVLVGYWAAVLLLAAVWVLYPLMLWLLVKIRRPAVEANVGLYHPTVSVVIAAHNEAGNLAERIENIYAMEYPADRLQVVIASDGSTDSTRELIADLRQKFEKLTLVDVFPQGGRANAHNKAIPHCTGDVLLFTDAETVFAADFLKRIVRPFEDRSVGFASGILKYRNEATSQVTRSAGLYWHFEYFLRTQESLLGVYAFGSGACCAVRRDLYRDIPPAGDVDFTTPLDVVLAGYRCKHVGDAVAYEVMPETPEREFRARVRMTAKNLYGTLMRWGWKGVAYHPIFTSVILLHKIGRWMTPFMMLTVLAFNFPLLNEGVIYVVALLCQLGFYALAISGYWGIRLPLANQAYSFCLANVGFLVGVTKVLRGDVPKFYKPVSQTKSGD